MSKEDANRARMQFLSVAATVVEKMAELKLVQPSPWPFELDALEAAAHAVLDLYLFAPYESMQQRLLKEADVAGLSKHMNALDKARRELSLAEQGMDQIGYAEAQRDHKPRIAQAYMDLEQCVRNLLKQRTT